MQQEVEVVALGDARVGVEEAGVELRARADREADALGVVAAASGSARSVRLARRPRSGSGRSCPARARRRRRARCGRGRPRRRSSCPRATTSASASVTRDHPAHRRPTGVGRDARPDHDRSVSGSPLATPWAKRTPTRVRAAVGRRSRRELGGALVGAIMGGSWVAATIAVGAARASLSAIRASSPSRGRAAASWRTRGHGGRPHRPVEVRDLPGPDVWTMNTGGSDVRRVTSNPLSGSEALRVDACEAWGHGPGPPAGMTPAGGGVVAAEAALLDRAAGDRRRAKRAPMAILPRRLLLVRGRSLHDAGRDARFRLGPGASASLPLTYVRSARRLRRRRSGPGSRAIAITAVRRRSVPWPRAVQLGSPATTMPCS